MSTCERCNGTGLEDSGGVQPWGEQIFVECECRLMERNMEKSRKAFEYWLEKYHGLKAGDVNYANMIEMYWQAWKASREAIEIELLSDKRRMDWLVSKAVNVRNPMVYGSHSMFWSQAITDEEDDYYETKLREQIDEAMDAEAIRAAGIKVKE